MNEEISLLEDLIKIALKEDHIDSDITTNSLLKYDRKVYASVYAKEEGVIAGTDVFRRVFLAVDKEISVEILKSDGENTFFGDKVISIHGKESSILKAERTALNFLQRLSGIATGTKKYTEKLKGTDIILLDTRKTTPGMRYLEKAAVISGGGHNHRMNLEDMAMIKDNHIKMAGSITKAVKTVREKNIGKKIEVEVTSLDEISEAIKAGADIIMLDNFDHNLIKKAAKMKKGNIKFEISGNITSENISKNLIKGIDFISSGSITHSYRSLDLSLKIED